MSYLVRSIALLAGERQRTKSQPRNEKARCSPIRHTTYKVAAAKLRWPSIPALLIRSVVSITAKAQTGEANHHFRSSLVVIANLKPLLAVVYGVVVQLVPA